MYAFDGTWDRQDPHVSIARLNGKVLLNDTYNRYRRLVMYAEECMTNDWYHLRSNAICFACEGANKVFVCGDGNFSLKREFGRGQSTPSPKPPGSLFGPSKQEQRLWVDPTVLGKYDHVRKEVHSDCIADSFVLQSYDSNFRAGSDTRNRNEQYAVNGVFGTACARHGHIFSLADITHGEGHKYMLACMDVFLKREKELQEFRLPLSPEGSDKKIFIMYDIICLIEKRLKEEFPELRVGSFLLAIK
ncbi:hypothetical protein MBANPS3_002315 [Mucor bainieri]